MGGPYAGHMSNDDAKAGLSAEPLEAEAALQGRMAVAERGT